MREKRAEKIARALSDIERWHSHGHGISMDVLTRDLKLKINDYGADEQLSVSIREYFTLFEDYRTKLGAESAVHSNNRFLPLYTI